VELETSPHLAFKESSRETRFGTAELVGLLHRVAARVASQAPGARLHVGDLSREGGGRFGPHRSHRSGRDADLGFYLVDAAGSPVLTPRFHDIRRDGTSRQDPSIRLDEARTWQLVEALVTDQEAPVQFIFLAHHLEERLLAEGRRQGASEELLARVDAVIEGDRRHSNHMHVRIYCPLDDVPRCDEEPPFHAWVDRSAARAAMATARAEQARARRSARTSARRRTPQRALHAAPTRDGGGRAARGSSAAGAR
jgi:penicillin-insensitive murein endopeptidase